MGLGIPSELIPAKTGAVPATVGQVARFFPFTGGTGAGFGDYRVGNVGTNSQGRISFDIPDDFGSLIELVLVGIPAASFTNQDIDLLSDYGAVGELKDANSEADTTSVRSGTADTILEYDISGIFTAIEAGDYCGLQVDHNSIGVTVGYLGVRMRYNKA